MVLEHETDAAPAQPRALRVVERAGLLSFDEQPSAGRLVQEADQIEQRRLARTGGADQCGKFALLQDEVDAVQDFRLHRRADAIGLAHALEAQRFDRSGRLSHAHPRMATAGSSLAARRAGTAAARMPTSVAPAAASTNSIGSITMMNMGVPSAFLATPRHSIRNPQPSSDPSSEPDSPMTPPCTRNRRSTCMREVP